MNAHSVIEGWETARFDGGFRGLAELGTRGFDGAVEAAGTWLFLRDGEPIAVISDLETAPRPADIDAFEDASGQTHEAPNAAVVTLAAMLALDGEVRGEYFSDDTPLSAVHETLSDGGFTGYVELSENVLSGDYYYVYVDGDVEHLGFVGSSQRITGEEAQTKAENEIGIYAVVAVSLPDLELPDAPAEPEPEPDSTPTPGSKGESASESTPEPGSSESPTPTDEAESDTPTDAEEDSETGAEADTEMEADAAAGTDSNEDTASDTTTAGAESDSAATADSDDDSPTPTSEPTSDDERHRAENDSADTSGVSEPSGSSDTTASATDPTTEGTESIGPDTSQDPYPAMNGDDGGHSDDTDTSSKASPPGSVGESGGSPDPSDSDRGHGSSEVNSLATRQVPSLDPQNSERGDESAGGIDVTASRGNPSAERTKSTESTSKTESESTSATSRESDRPTRKEYEERIDEYEERIDELEATVTDRETRIEELESELETLREERDELQAELDAIDTGGVGDSTGTTRSLSPTEALSETSLFVREDTRGGDTLEDGHDGTADRDEVTENLHIEFHTTFDSDGVTVEGEPFEEWLRSSSPYAFAEWLVTDLLFEIRSTGAQDGLKPLYDALPVIDRVGFDETIPIDSGSEDREVSFDIVARDKKGNPLAVAHFDQQRDPTYAETIEPFVTDSSDVGEAHETLAAAVVVTSSYFEADAMRATEEATSTSLLSRSKYRSYVKLSRSDGFHLCLVEARDGSFNLNVPEL